MITFSVSNIALVFGFRVVGRLVTKALAESAEDRIKNTILELRINNR
jgi:hypothetical protein